MLTLTDIKNTILSNRIIQFGLTLFIGIAIGALCYPSKHIEQKVSQKYEQQISQMKDEQSKQLKQMQDEMTKEEASYKNTIDDKNQQLTQLTNQISTLKSHQHSTYYKVVHPDGTVEVRKSNDSQTEESEQIAQQVQQEYQDKLVQDQKEWQTEQDKKTVAIQTQYDSQIKTYQQQIATLESSKVEDTNKKKYGLEVGTTTDQSYYIHMNADIWGPFFVGAHGSIGQDKMLGGGLGIRF